MGKETLGRIINVIGEPVDEQGPVSKSPSGLTSLHMSIAGLALAKTPETSLLWAVLAYRQSALVISWKTVKALCLCRYQGDHGHPQRSATIHRPEHRAGNPCDRASRLVTHVLCMDHGPKQQDSRWPDSGCKQHLHAGAAFSDADHGVHVQRWWTCWLPTSVEARLGYLVVPVWARPCSSWSSSTTLPRPMVRT